MLLETRSTVLASDDRQGWRDCDELVSSGGRSSMGADTTAAVQLIVIPRCDN